jgi:transcriptional regulator with XRE-family HTH domain
MVDGRTARTDRKRTEVAERVRQLRRLRGITAAQLSERAQLSTSYISQLERGRVHRPAEYALERIAKVLGVEAAELITLAGYVDMESVLEGVEPSLIASARMAPPEVQREFARLLAMYGDAAKK